MRVVAVTSEHSVAMLRERYPEVAFERLVVLEGLEAVIRRESLDALLISPTDITESQAFQIAIAGGFSTVPLVISGRLSREFAALALLSGLKRN